MLFSHLSLSRSHSTVQNTFYKVFCAKGKKGNDHERESVTNSNYIMTIKLCLFLVCNPFAYNIPIKSVSLSLAPLYK